MSKENDLFLKEKIDEQLCKVMKDIDTVMWSISTDFPDKYDFEVTILSRVKSDVKRILNKHFDQCARNK